MKDRGVKQRREDRIRAILEREHGGRELPASQAIPVGREGAAERMHSVPVRVPVGSPNRMKNAVPAPDPETEWKRKSKEWLQAGTAPRSAWSGGDEPDAPRRPPAGGRSFLRGVAIRLVVSLVLFAAVWGLFRLDMPGAEPVKSFVLRGLTEELDTAAVAAWYEEHFRGAPSFIPIFRQHDEPDAARRVSGAVKLTVVPPVAGGTVVRSFAETLGGIEIAAASEGPVGAIETGRVSQVAGSETAGYSVVIQHASARVSIYGHLSSADVQPGDWVEAGDRIGAMPVAAERQDSLLYFAVQEKGKYVDPTDVIRFD